MKKRMLAFILVVLMVLEMDMGFFYAQEPLVISQEVQEINGETALETEEQWLQDEVNTKTDTGIEAETSELEMKEEDTEAVSPELETEAISEPETELESEPETEQEVLEGSVNDGTEVTESESNALPSSEPAVPSLGIYEYFDCYDVYEDYYLGETHNSIMYEESDYILLKLTQQKNIKFDFNLNWSYFDDGDVVIKIHKVKFEKADEDDYYDEDYYVCIKCVLNTTVKTNSAGLENISKTLNLAAGSYVIEIGSPDEDTFVNYTMKTSDVTTYATSVSIPSSCYVNVGKSQQINVTNILPAGSVKGISWASSDNSIAKVDTDGKVTGVKYGNCEIIAALKNGTKYTCKVFVEDPTFNVNEKNFALRKGQSKTLKLKNVHRSVTWKSSDTSVAAVNETSGEVEAKKKGSAIITATVAGQNYKLTVKVEEPKINKTSVKVVAGDTYKLIISGTTQTVKWKSSNKSVAAVSDGLVTTKKKGTATISATVLGKTFTCKVKVNKSKLKKTSIKMIKGTTQQLEWKSKVRNVKWSSENKKIATVDNKGIITAKKAGTTKIIAKVGSARYVCGVTCEAPKISKSTLTLDKKKTATLSVTGTTMKVTWKSSDTNIATVNTKGKVTAKKQGKTTIVASVGGKDFSCKLTVNGDKPAFSGYISSDTDYNCYGAIVGIINNGKETIRIYSQNARLICPDMSYYNRNCTLVSTAEMEKGNIVPIDYVDIQPGAREVVVFLVNTASTYYSKYSKMEYDFTYDGVDYRGSSSSYYGNSYWKR